MPKLTRIYTSGIGTKVARFSPLTVDFRNAQNQPEDTIVWLRNGGGKTCWLALVYSIFKPRSQHFLLKKAKGRDSSIMDFIQANDLAFVITEWDISGDQMRLGSASVDPRNLRIVGQVMAWRNGQKADDRGKLKHQVFSFRCSEKFNLETMPIMGHSANPAKTFEDFTDWLNSVDGRNEPVINPGHDDWEQHLTDIGLDPALIQFQITMNQREGDIDQYFKDFCNTSEKFTHEFLKMAFDTNKAEKVSHNIIAWKSKLQHQGPLEHENAFIGGFLGALDPFLQEVVAMQTHQQALDLARTKARGAQSAMVASLLALNNEREQEKVAEQNAGTRAQTALNAAQELQKNIYYFHLRHDHLATTAAADALAQAENKLAVATEYVKSCRAAVTMSELSDLRNRERALQRELRSANDQVQPVREDLLRRGALYREILRLQILHHNQRLADIKHQQEQLRAKETLLHTQLQDTQQTIGRAEAQQQQFQEKVNDRDSTFRSLLNNGIIEEGETASTARDRLEEANRVSNAEIVRLKDVVEQKNSESEQIRATITEQQTSLRELEHKRLEIDAFINKIETMRRKLEANKHILDITLGKTPDLVLPNLLEGLKNQLSYQQRAYTEAEVDSAEDQRAIKHLDQTGLLPPPLDVEKALQQFRAASIPAQSAFEFLSQNVLDPEEALKLLLDDPSKFTGIIVNRKEDVEEIRNQLTGRSALKAPVQVSASSLEVWGPVPDRVSLPPATNGAFNRRAAQDERAHIQDRLAKHKTSQDKINEEIAGLSAAVRELVDYLENFSPKMGQARTEQEAVRNNQGILRIAIQDNQNRVQANKNEVIELGKQISQEQLVISERQTKLLSLHSFIRDLDANYEANKQKVQQLSETLEALTLSRTSINEQSQLNRESLSDLTEQEVQIKTDRGADEKEQAEVQEYSADRPEIGEATLSQARADYKVKLAVYQKISSSTLQGQLQELQISIKSKETQLNTASKGLHRIKIEALAIRPTLAADLQAAEDDNTARSGDRAVAQSNHKRLDALYKQTNLKYEKKHLKPDGLVEPETPDQAKVLQEDFEARLARKNIEHDAAKNEMAGHKAKITALDQSISQRTSIKEELEEMPLGEGAPVEIVLPQDDTGLKTFVRGIKKDLKALEETLKKSQLRLNERFEAIQKLLTAPDEPGFENAMKLKLKAIPQPALIQGAEGIKESATTRRAVIEKELAAIEQDRKVIIIELGVVHQEAKNLLNSAERVSRLPDNMTGWAGLPFLRIKLPELSEADVNLKLRDLLDLILKENECPDGLELAYRCIVQTAGLEGIKITILKPDVVLRPDRIPVESISYFSGGEGVTTAILLYCTLLQLRAQTHGRVTFSKDAGALLLDNPIGKCSRSDLLKMHREISSKMRVQLIYLTGVNDASALGTFDRIVRLKNQHKNIRNGDLHVTLDPDSRMEKAEVQMPKTHA